MENTIELTGVKFKRSAYRRGDGMIINISGKLAELCGLSGCDGVEMEIIKGGGVVVRPLVKESGNVEA